MHLSLSVNCAFPARWPCRVAACLALAALGMLTPHWARAQGPSVVVYPFRANIATLRGYYLDSLGVLVASSTVAKLSNNRYRVKDRAFQVECMREGARCLDDPGDLLYVGTVLEVGEGQTLAEKVACRLRQEMCRMSIRVKLQGQLINAIDRSVLATANGEATASGTWDLQRKVEDIFLMSRDNFWQTQLGRAIENASDQLFNRMRSKLPQPLGGNEPRYVAPEAAPSPDAPARVDLAPLRDMTIAVVLPESIISRPVPDPAAETEIQRYLLAQGVRVKDDARVRQLRDSKALLSLMNGSMDSKQMHEFQAEYGIDVLVSGEAFAEVVAGRFSPEQQPREARARVEIKAVHMASGDIIFSDGVQATGRDVTEATAGKKALMQGGRQIAPMLLEGLSKYFARGGGTTIGRSEGSSMLQLEVSGWTRLSDASSFLEAVRRLPGVRRATRRSYAGGIVIADIEVDTDKASELGGELETHASMKAFRLGLTEASDSRIVGNVAKGTRRD